ncbi:SWIM zinc finger family protein [Streptomyces sp. ATCC 21386]|uniref:SWIM zinc finger family protein n=1 Tax=Streptomyces sp. ATCC 21386 TaxID=2699428 RepID=UPI0027E40ADE|nr:SWIM zinc finger family protein [Streptomyces sp. ATCC 21386]
MSGDTGTPGGARAWSGEEGRGAEAERTPPGQTDDGSRSEAAEVAEPAASGGPASGAAHRPADAARRALRAARVRDGQGAEPGDGRGSAAAPGTGVAGPKSAADVPAAARPGDVAREALRRARTAEDASAQATTSDAPAAGEGDPFGAAPGTASAMDAQSGSAERPSAVPGAASAFDAHSDDGAAVRAGEDDAADAGPVDVGRTGRRPGDVAREALRAARDAERARVEAEGARAGAAGQEGRAARRSGASSARSRADRGTSPSPDSGGSSGGSGEAVGRGDPWGAPRGRAPGGVHEERRSAGTPAGRTLRDRTRELRELLAGAFELPAEEPDADETSAVQPYARTGTGTGTRTGTGWDRAADEPVSPHERTPGDRASRAPAAPDPGPGPDLPGTPPPDPALPAAHVPDAPTTPRVPRTMAAPSRDGELRRTFRPFPPRPSAGEAFAESWWGNAWVTALEEGALDTARLARGRAYADKGKVDAVTVTPGLVLAYVHGSRPRPYRVQLRLRTLDDAEWDRFLDAAAAQPGHIAALLDKELPHALAGPGARPAAGPGGRGVRLLPGAGELEPRCSCPDFGHPCKHAAALCYHTARLLDEDPFVLLLLRGRGERELIDALSRRNAARAARAAQEQEPAPLPGVRARDALAPRALPPLPAPAPPPPHPEQPPVYPGAPGGPDPFALDQLATDAAARAHALLTTGRDPVAELTLWQDAVRLAAARPGSGLTATTRALYSSLAAATGRTPADLARAVAAWRQGGLEGLTVLEEPWDPPAGRFDRARPLLLAADLPAFRPWRNHLTHPHGHMQLRLGQDGLWYAYESEPGHDDWWPRGTPDLDPVGALTVLGPADDD